MLYLSQLRIETTNSIRSILSCYAKAGKENSNEDGPENNPLFTTVYVGGIPHEVILFQWNVCCLSWLYIDFSICSYKCPPISWLRHQATNNDVHLFFHSLGVGSIEEVRVTRDKCFGFVRYSTHEEAALAIQMGNGQLIGGRPIRVYLVWTFQASFLLKSL